jgi:hypothetical protein
MLFHLFTTAGARLFNPFLHLLEGQRLAQLLKIYRFVGVTLVILGSTPDIRRLYE